MQPFGLLCICFNTTYFLSHAGFQRHHDVTVNDRLFIKFPVSDYPWTLTFTSMKYNYTITLMKAGKLFKEEQTRLLNRISLLTDGIYIDPIETGDAGTFKFIDSKGNVAKTVQVELPGELQLKCFFIYRRKNDV